MSANTLFPNKIALTKTEGSDITYLFRQEPNSTHNTSPQISICCHTPAINSLFITHLYF